MKKLFITSVLALGLSAVLYSCNNGAYDSDPTVDNTAVKNPLDPNSGTTVYLGSMEAMINGVMVLFAPVYHVTDTFNVRRLYAFGKDDSVYYRRLVITFPENTYNGPADYNIGSDAAGVDFDYKEYDPELEIFKSYQANTSNGSSNKVIFSVKGDEGGHMRGMINGTLLKTLPLTGKVDSASFTNTEYYSEMRAFPLK